MYSVKLYENYTFFYTNNSFSDVSYTNRKCPHFGVIGEQILLHVDVVMAITYKAKPMTTAGLSILITLKLITTY